MKYAGITGVRPFDYRFATGLRRRTMDREKRITRVKMPTWFGVEAHVETGPGFFHKAGLGPFLIPHPPLINWLLRLHMPEEAKNDVSVIHEFGHLQTAPLALLAGIVLFALAITSDHTSWTELLIVLISIHTAWEVMAEIFTIASAGSRYGRLYENISRVPRITFWTVTGGFSIFGWYIAVR